MYPWVDFTWNPLGGRCPHDCDYCYMKRPPVCWTDKYKGPQRLWEKELKVNLHGLSLNRRINLPFIPDDVVLIFVCSGNDLGAAPRDAKLRILRKCREEERNFYLFQSKNPAGFKEVEGEFPSNTILGTTLETDRTELCKAVSRAPAPYKRVEGMILLKNSYHKMVSIEPKMDCSPEVLNEWIKEIAPAFVSVGADSGGNNLTEPSPDKVQDLIMKLEKHTIVLKKNNLGRLLIKK